MSRSFLRSAKEITTAIQDAMKAGDKNRVAVLRLLSAAVRNTEVEKKRPLETDEILEVVGREVSRREEAATEYRKAGREDRATQEEAEAEILRVFLPEPLDPTEIERIVDEAMAATGASSPQDMGKVMGALMPQIKGRADGKKVSDLVRSKLAQ